MKTLLVSAIALAIPMMASADGLDPIGDRIGYHSHNGCQIVVYAEPRTALFGLIPVRWDYTTEGRQCKRAYDEANRDDDGDDNDNEVEVVTCRSCLG